MPEEEKTERKELHTMPTLALRGLTIYPKMMVHFDVGREASIKAIEEAMSSNHFPGGPEGHSGGGAGPEPSL